MLMFVFCDRCPANRPPPKYTICSLAHRFASVRYIHSFVFLIRSVLSVFLPAITKQTNTHTRTHTAGLLGGGHPNYPHPMYLGGSIVGHHGTLRRPREYEHTPPRILSKIDGDQPYYYG